MNKEPTTKTFLCKICNEYEPCKLTIPISAQDPILCPYGFRTWEDKDESNWEKLK